MSTNYIEEKKSSITGITALVFSFLGFITTLVLSIIAGSQISNVPPEQLLLMTQTGGADSISAEYYKFITTASAYLLISILVGAILGLVGIIVGIIAIAKKKGRIQGLFAIVLAVVYPIISSIVFGVLSGVAAAA